jgi:hypothetical protein
MSEFDIPQAVPQKQDWTSSQSMKRQIADAGAEVSQHARDARASKDVARDTFKEASDTAAEVAEGAAEQFRGKAEEQQRSGADFIDRLAGNIRQAAHAFENDAPFAARGINSSADYVEDAAEKIRNGTFRDLVDGASDFAKRQPAAFLGLSVLAGFAAVRFFRASEKHTASSQQEDV